MITVGHAARAASTAARGMSTVGHAAETTVIMPIGGG
jgi:hypothetical protein